MARNTTSTKTVKATQGPKPALAAPLIAIANTGAAVEDAAGRLLTTIRAEGIADVKGFDEAITAAFDANGWNTRPGKPAKDRRAVPHTVRTYVWEIRAAFRAGVDVGKCKTMYEVRMARHAAKLAEAPPAPTEAPGEPLPVEVEQDLLGVRVLAPKQPNGALFHDLIALFIRLPGGERDTLGRQLARLMHQYQAKVTAGAAQPQQRAA